MGGVDLEVVFPNPFLLTGCNLYLRADPSRLAAEPYTGGWLFEGDAGPETTAGLMGAGAARRGWKQEQGRMNEFLQQQHGQRAAVRPMAACSRLAWRACWIATACWLCSTNFSRLLRVRKR